VAALISLRSYLQAHGDICTVDVEP
jgi:hypothetical protein